MNSLDGIRRLKRAMNLTPEGRELFNKLSRYKLSEMIDKKMMDKLDENIRLGKFSGLLESGKDQAIVKELVGNEAFKRIELLQKNAARLTDSANKFYNASKSGTTLADVGAASSMLVGILTLNPYLFFSSLAGIGGLNLSARLLADAEFLKLLEKSILTNNKEKLLELLKAMQPHVEKASVAASLESREDR